MTIVLLKNQGTADPYAELSQHVVFVPLMEHTFVEQAALRDYLESLEFEQVDCVLVTSQRAVEAIAEVLHELTDVGRISVLSKPTFTVGPATAALLRLKGFSDVRGDDSGNGTVLAKVLEKQPFKRYVFFTGESRRDAIPDTLNSMEGVKLEEKVVYKTVQVDQARERFATSLKTSKIDKPAVVFFSPASADPIVDELLKHDRKEYVLAAIGPTTEEYLNSFGLKPDAVAVKPDPESLERALSGLL